MARRTGSFCVAILLAIICGTRYPSGASADEFGRRMSDAAISNYLTFGPPRTGFYDTYGYEPGYFGGYPAYRSGGWHRARYPQRAARYIDRPIVIPAAPEAGYGGYTTGTPNLPYGYYSTGTPSIDTAPPLPRRGGVFDR